MYLCAEIYRIPFTEWLSWREGDRQKAIAWELRRRETCPQCMTRPEEWQTKDGKRAYEPAVISCIGCRELAKVNKSISEKARDFTRVVLRVIWK